VAALRSVRGATAQGTETTPTALDLNLPQDFTPTRTCIMAANKKPKKKKMEKK
jgi:hypothetical protein